MGCALHTSKTASERPPTWGDCEPFVPPIHGGYVIKVYDGDTITVASKLPYAESPLYRFQVRLRGIDAPELRSKDVNEAQAAKAAQLALEQLVLHKTVSLRSLGTEKYGRVLADVYLDALCVNTYMVDNNFAARYLF